MTDISKRALWCGASVLALTAAFSSSAMAGVLPTHGHFVSGQGSIGKAGQSLTVRQSSTTGIIDWNSFSVGKKSNVAFNNGAGATLNRVMGGNPSAIAGSLHATGSLYIMNSAGVIVSGTGRIVTEGSFVATSGNIANSAFDNGNRRFGLGAGSVVNKGTIVSGGAAELSGRNVISSGTIRASAVALSATHKLGIAGSVIAHSNDGSGGTITARARDIVIATDGTIDASASAAGQTGGSIRIAARSAAAVAGTLKAEGGVRGAGGFIETSGEQVHVANSAHVSTQATDGKTGTWLIDPNDFTIAASGGDITGATLSGQLASNDIDIKSHNGANAGAGDIFVNDAVTWSSSHSLTLDAFRNIDFNAPITVSGAGGVSLIDGDHAQNGVGNAARGDLLFNSGNIAFTNVASGTSTGLKINGQAYTLENNLADLSSAISSNSAGFYALAGSEDVAGTRYTQSPIQTIFSGTLEGLGNSISGLHIIDNAGGNIGLFAETDGATLRDVALDNISIVAIGQLDSNNIGGLVGLANNTTINHASVTGTIVAGSAANGQGPAVGGLVGDWTLAGAASDVSSDVSIDAGANARAGSLSGLLSGSGTLTGSRAGGDVIVGLGGEAGGFAAEIDSIAVTYSYASGMVSVAGAGNAGGFAGAAGAETLSYDYATGDVFLGQGANGNAGGFAGTSSATLDHSWASGSVLTAGAQNGNEVISGGFVGDMNSGTITNSFATGNVTSGNASENMIQGGFVGFMSGGAISNSYSTGTVTGNAIGAAAGSELYGGFAGYIRGTILKSYETGAVLVSGPAKVGGFVGQSDPTAAVDESYEFGKVTVDAPAIAGGFAGDNENTAGIGVAVADYFNKTANTLGGVGHDVASTESDVGGIAAANMFKKSSYHGWSFGKSTKGTGWVTVDTDGTFNNAGGIAGGTLPMLLSEYSKSIASAHQLQLVGLDVSADYTLANTINASGTSGGDVWGTSGFVHIGSSGSQYAGTFDGADYAIVGLAQKNTADAFGGMFYGLSSGGIVENLGLVNVSIDNAAMNGGSDGVIIAGFSNGALIDDYTTGKVKAGASGTSGGLAGFNDGTISHSWSSATISGTAGTADGGLVGINNGSITTSYATGNVTVTIGDTSFSGGLVGINNGGTIDTSYSSGTVKGAGDTAAGAFAGKNTGSISRSFFNSTNNGSTPGVQTGSSTGVSHRTTAELSTASNFSGWTFGALGSGADWVIVDLDGSLNNDNGAIGGTSPILLSEYSNTISNAHQLQLMELNPAATYTLANDIDAGGTSGAGDVWRASGFVAVGGNNASADFSGTFDGAGYKIGRLFINDATNDDVGLFGLTDTSSDISNVTLTSESVHSVASFGTGGVVGANTGTISGVTVHGTVSGTGDVSDAASVGGLAGYNDGLVLNAQSSAVVTATHDGSGAGAGGLVGFATVDSEIEDSFATGAVNMEGDLIAAGGLVGLNGGFISQSFASGAVKLTDPQNISGNSAGGLVGDNDAGIITQSYALGNVQTHGGAPVTSAGGFAGGNSGQISQSFSLGSVDAPVAGGFVGFEDNNTGLIASSYWDIQTSGLSSGAGQVLGNGTVGLAGKSTKQLEAALPPGFSSAAWSIVAGTSLPYLNWQFASGSPQVVSGVLSDGIDGDGVANSIVSLLQDGADLDSVLTVGSVVTYANGFYYFLLAPDSIDTSSNSGLLVYDRALHAAIFDDQASGSETNLDLTRGYLREMTDQTQLSELNRDLARAVAGNNVVNTLLAATPNLEIDDTGSLNINRALRRANHTIIIDAANGAVDQSAAITSSVLVLEGDANFTLNDKSNDISTLAMTGNGSLSFTNGQGLTIGDAAGVTGVDAGGSVVLTTKAGSITIEQLLEAHNHALTLKSAKGISEKGSGALEAETLSGRAQGSVELDGTKNEIANLGSFATGGGNFSLTDDHTLKVAGKMNAKHGTLSLATVGKKHDLVIAGKLTGGEVNLVTAGAVTENSKGSIVASTLLNVTAETGITLTSKHNAIKKLGKDKTTSGPNKVTL